MDDNKKLEEKKVKEKEKEKRRIKYLEDFTLDR